MTDSSTNNNNGTLSGGTAYTNAVYGQGVWFDGTNGFADCGTGDSLSFSSNINFTITFRAAINPTSLSYACIISKKGSRGSNRPGFMVKLESGLLKIQFADVPENTVQASALMDVDDGVWRNYTFTADRDGYATIYIDGATNGTPVDISGIGDINSIRSLCLGTIGFKNSQWFNGKLDDVAIFDEVLDNKAIQKIYINGVAEYLLSGGTVIIVR